MIILLLFAFLSGLVTILAPCIWPLLPIVLSASATGGKKRPLGITLGIMISFSIFTLGISTLVSLFHIDPDLLRLLAVIVISIMGITFLIPALSIRFETLISRLVSKLSPIGKNSASRSGFSGGIVTGLSLGIVWSPCAGPILATIAALASAQTLSLQLFLVTIFYVTGVGIPLFLFAYGGSAVLSKSKTFRSHTGQVQQIFGLVMIITAVLIYTNYDKVIQAKLLDAFPSYSTFLLKLETNPGVTSQLNALKGKKAGAPVNENPVMNVFPGSKLPVLGRAPEFTGISNWLNTASPLTMSGLRGKVVLVDFWTYTCINCIRTLPHVVGWYEKYKDKGFVVVGVHTPEFEFEKKTDNVKMAISQYGIHYPVPQDNAYATWNAFNNQYWPAKYLIDADGNIRYTHFGEGEYDTTEMAIKQLLSEAGNKIDNGTLSLPDQTPNAPLSPETYLGSKRMDRFASNESVKGGQQNFSLPNDLSPDNWGYGGSWNVSDEYATAGKGSALEFEFNASKVYLVIHPGSLSDSVKVFIDGKPVDNNNAGADVEDGLINVTEPRLYNLVDLHGKTETHRLRLEFDTDGTQVYAFTFG